MESWRAVYLDYNTIRWETNAITTNDLRDLELWWNRSDKHFKAI